MSRFPELIVANTEAARIAYLSDETVDNAVGDLVLRNTIVALDRLSADQFYSLKSPATRELYEVASLADDLAPMHELDKVRMSHESDAEFAYRRNLRHPIGALQSKFNSYGFSLNNPDDITKAKRAILLGAIAFETIVTETANLPEILETERYFWGNTNAALRRAESI